MPGEVLGEPVCTGFAFDPWVGVPLGLVVIAAPFAVGAFLMARAERGATPAP